MDMADKYYADPEIVFRRKGETGEDPQNLKFGASEWRGGPVTETGYYIIPFCHPSCCRPDGPFPDERSALEAARRKIGKQHHRP